MKDPIPLAELARRFYLDEMNDHLTYSVLAAHARDARLRAVLGRIAAMERRHADFWGQILASQGLEVPAARPRRLRLAALRLLQCLVNPLLLVSALELGESRAQRTYFTLWRSQLLEAPQNETLRGIIMDELEHESTFRQESRSRGLSHVRDFVLGMNDGLVEILGAVTGLSAAYPGRPLLVGVSGLIVGVAGAMSMGIGAYISVRSQRQVNDGAREHMEILFAVAPQRAVQEYRARLAEAGVPQALTAEIARQVALNEASLKRLLIEPVGEDELRSGLLTGLAYLFGVVFPVLPYFVAEDSSWALGGSVTLASAALASVGFVVSVLSGISLRTKVAEMVISGFSAAALAYFFGKAMQSLFGIGVGL